MVYFTNTRHAYRPGHATNTALVHMTDLWLANVDVGKLVGAVLLDIIAAFDVIEDRLLMLKLEKYVFSPLALAWLHSNLSSAE